MIEGMAGLRTATLLTAVVLACCLLPHADKPTIMLYWMIQLSTCLAPMQ